MRSIVLEAAAVEHLSGMDDDHPGTLRDREQRAPWRADFRSVMHASKTVRRFWRADRPEDLVRE